MNPRDKKNIGDKCFQYYQAIAFSILFTESFKITIPCTKTCLLMNNIQKIGDLQTVEK